MVSRICWPRRDGETFQPGMEEDAAFLMNLRDACSVFLVLAPWLAVCFVRPSVSSLLPSYILDTYGHLLNYLL